MAAIQIIRFCQLNFKYNTVAKKPAMPIRPNTLAYPDVEWIKKCDGRIFVYDT
jgi:hypothetical protein